MITRRHERDYADIRTHLRNDHGVQAVGMVRLATFLRHRRLHSNPGGHVDRVSHTHGPRL